MLHRRPLKLTSTSTTTVSNKVTGWQQAIIFGLLLSILDTTTTVNGWNLRPTPNTRIPLPSFVSLLFARRSSIKSMMTMVSPSSPTSADAHTTTTSNNNPKPKLPIPEPIYSNIPGTWAYDTMSRRVDEEILQRTYNDNKEMFETEAFSSIKAKFDALRKDLQTSSTLKMLDDLPKDATPERRREWQEWKEILQPFLDRQDTWLTAPWMVTEFYVYRRLVDAIGYWDVDSPGYHYDPFSKQKRAGLMSSVGSVRLMMYCNRHRQK
jgi:hypothetical protein